MMCCIFFRAQNALYYYCVVFSAHGTRSGVIVFYFPACGRCSTIIASYFLRVECALALLCYILRAWNALWCYCVIFSARGMRSGIIVLYYPCVECALALLCHIFCAWNGICYFVLNLFRVVIYLPCDFPVFISKLSKCKGIELSAAFLAAFIYI